jgi:hypothetical protein
VCSTALHHQPLSPSAEDGTVKLPARHGQLVPSVRLVGSPPRPWSPVGPGVRNGAYLLDARLICTLDLLLETTSFAHVASRRFCNFAIESLRLQSLNGPLPINGNVPKLKTIQVKVKTS